ncbi:MAG: 50S ribosomal protein L10 [Candidatus Aenigmarchaeota archaeon]|jgi:large subunit ribosomal protein L10|nr:50S ribosomal protein L10 [Candidatus Aenigmarchaeota archaeon]
MKKEEKIALAEEIAREMKNYKTVGIIDLYRIPTKEYKEIKKAISEFAKLKVIKKSTLKFAAEKAGNTFRKLLELNPNQFAILFSNEEPFTLFKKISSVTSDTYAKENDVAEEDIWIYAGPTQIKAGPSISEFARLKIPVGVEGGFIAVKKDTQVAKKGDKISKELAALLRKLKIKAKKVRLNILGLLHKDVLYSREMLNLVFEYPKLLLQAYQNALNLTTNISYPTKENINILISKCYLMAKTLEKLVVK